MAQIMVEGAALNVRVEGPDDGEAVILAHHLGGSLEVFDAVAPALAERFRLVRYDCRGHGASAASPAPYSIFGLARDAIALLDALGIERAHWIGLSMGGMTGLAAMLAAPSRIGRAALANTAAKVGSPDLWNGRIRAARRDGPASLSEATQARWFTPEFLAAEPAAVEKVMANFRATSAEGYAGGCAALRDADLREAIGGVSHKVLVVAGARDPSSPPELAAFVAGAIEGAGLATLDTSHMSAVEDAEGFAAAVLAFLAEPQAKTRMAAPPRKVAARRPSGRPKLAVRTPAAPPAAARAAPAKGSAEGAAKAPKTPAPAKTSKAPQKPAARKPDGTAGAKPRGAGPKDGPKGGPKGGGGRPRPPQSER
ncbi:alpha/beta fold hydrolase [Methylocella sp.]|uniref:alpha/beta fold hydrolase n=1 Tax=Methylocella sp. TaxID=1978226 RepID=UPI0035B39141